MTFQQKMMLVCLLCMLVPVGAFYVFFYQKHEMNQRHAVESVAREYLNERIRDVNRCVERVEDLENSFARNQKFIRFFASDFVFNSKQDYEYTNIICPLIWQSEYANADLIERVSIFCKNETIPTYGTKIRYLSEIENHPEWEFFLEKSVKSCIKLFDRGFFSKKEGTKDLNFQFVRRLFHTNGTQMSIMMCQVPIEKLGLYVFGEEMNTPFAMLYQDRLIYSSPGFQEEDFGNKKNWVSSEAAIPGLKLYVRLNIETIKEVQRLNATVYISIVLGFICMTFAIRLLLRILFRNLNRIVLMMTELVSSGDFSRRIPQDNRRDELAKIVISINTLLGYLNDSIDQLIQKEIEKKQVQLLALQYQINPHFIYNALNLIQLAIEDNGDQQLSDAIIYFVRVLRYNTSSSMDSCIKDEIKNGMDYINFVNTWRESLIELVCDVPDQIANVKLIRFVIQPILENAVHYSIIKTDRCLCIHIIIRYVNNQLTIQVSNNTEKDIDSKKLSKINSEIEAQSSGVIKRKGKKSIGLANILYRLKIYYGPDSKLFISYKEGITTTNISLNDKADLEYT